MDPSSTYRTALREAVLEHRRRDERELGPCADEGVRVDGTVEQGDQRGRLLGFPTANVTVNAQGLRDGVWAGTVQILPKLQPHGEEVDDESSVYVAAVSIGHRPTFYDRSGKRLLEAHLLDYDGDLYGRRVVVRLHARLRPQRRFATSEDLMDQLALDISATRAWAASAGHGRRAGDRLPPENGDVLDNAAGAGR